MKIIRLMSKQELKNALVRAIILEYQNTKTPGRMSWGHDAPTSILVARKNRIRLAKMYSQKYDPVSKILFHNKLPSGKAWKGTRVLVSNPIHRWVNSEFIQIGCTVPLKHSRAK